MTSWITKMMSTHTEMTREMCDCQHPLLAPPLLCCCLVRCARNRNIIQPSTVCKQNSDSSHLFVGCSRKKASRGFEPRSLDSESRVLTVTPRGLLKTMSSRVYSRATNGHRQNDNHDAYLFAAFLKPFGLPFGGPGVSSPPPPHPPPAQLLEGVWPYNPHC